MTTPVLLQHLIGGAWRRGGGRAIASVSPTDPTIVVAEGLAAGAGELDDAIKAATSAAVGWASTPAHERGAVLIRAAAIVEAASEQWGQELSREEGKTLAEGVGEVLRAAHVLRYFAGDADHEAGEIYHSPRRGERILVTRRPVGVVGVITPFNFPIAIPAWKIAPALFYGNTVVWKPASAVPLLAMRLAQALTEAGLPDGVLNLLIGPGSLGGALTEHAGVDAVTFTGSTGVGRAIAAAAAARGVPVQAEMGGKNAAVVLDDAELEVAVTQVIAGAFNSTGQKCTATSRLIVTDGIYDEFVALLVQRAGELTVGDPVADGTRIGPVVDGAARESIEAGIRAALDQGARQRLGSQTTIPDTGHFVAPTILEVPSTDVDLWRDELFGPVLAVHRVAGTAEAFAMANDSEFGLSASVFTRNLSTALSAVDHIAVGVLHINSESAGADPHVPFGGAKKSGYGPREQGPTAKDFFTEQTTVYLRGC